MELNAIASIRRHAKGVVKHEGRGNSTNHVLDGLAAQRDR